MIKGYSLPLTLKGASSLASMPPWHYLGTCLAVEYEGESAAVAAFLLDGLDYQSPQCALFRGMAVRQRHRGGISRPGAQPV